MYGIYASIDFLDIIICFLRSSSFVKKKHKKSLRMLSRIWRNNIDTKWNILELLRNIW